MLLLKGCSLFKTISAHAAKSFEGDGFPAAAPWKVKNKR
jgi:hypothetical protein